MNNKCSLELAKIGVEFLYIRLICGGIGYSPRLYRYKRKYYHIKGACELESLKVLANSKPFRPVCKNGYSLWARHRNDNVVTAKEFIDLIKQEQKC